MNNPYSKQKSYLFKISAFIIVCFYAILFSSATWAFAASGKASFIKDNFLTRLWNYGSSGVEKESSKKTVPESVALNPRYKTYKIVIDPGHGGKSEKASLTEGDHWDIKARKFLTRYNYGAYHEQESEEKIVLEICKKTFEILKSANSDKGWREFAKLLSSYGVKKPEEYRRVNFDAGLTRDKSFDSPEYKDQANVNRHFRLFDSPESFDDKKKPSEVLFPGRMSKINMMTPELVLCVHINSSNNPDTRGQASVIIPDYHVFDFVKTVKTRLGVKSALTYFWLISWFYPQNSILSNLSRLINDCETYFTGKRSDNKSQIGKRWQMVKWRYSKDDEYDNLLNYKDPDSYWKRERSDHESMRRDGGIIGAGGDNFYASEEVIKFIRLGLWQDYISGVSREIKEINELKSPAEYLGAHGAPFISDWALPQLVNAVTAYVELGYIENEHDRRILVTKKDVIAKSMAVAVYSLIEGLEPKKVPVTRDELISRTPSLKILASAAAAETPAQKETAKEQQKRLVKLVDNLKKELKGGDALKTKQTSKNGVEEKEKNSKTPLVLPFSQRIDFEKYGDYFKSVLK
ncbi:MAG TPA: hypothetical protein PK467_07360 [Candidatus Wallbacteria bacterium]|nr:hypothetical protein [Candidatus Wallbacteria bacterium]